MKFLVFLVAICCSVPSQGSLSHGGGHLQLSGVPDLSDYGKLTYPKYDVIHLGTDIKSSLPPTTVQITEYKTVNIPQPYPVKVPVPHPVLVPVAKPYPVVETKILKVPVPVPSGDYQHHHHEGGDGGGDGFYGSSFGENAPSEEEGYGYGNADQSQNYVAQLEAQKGWSPVEVNQEQQNEQEH